MTGPGVDAVIFDMDGLLIDTEPVWRDAERKVFAEIGLDLTEEEMTSTMGVRIEDVVAHWRHLRPWPFGQYPRLTDGALADLIVDHLVTQVAHHGVPQPGVAHAFEAARELNVPVAIASSSPPRLITAVCSRLGLEDVAVRCSASQEARGKPAPDVYLTAARRLGVRPNRCVAIEDSPNGVRSARAAGMRCIAVPDPLVAADPAFAQADVILPSLADVDAACLGGQITG